MRFQCRHQFPGLGRWEQTREAGGGGGGGVPVVANLALASCLRGAPTAAAGPSLHRCWCSCCPPKALRRGTPFELANGMVCPSLHLPFPLWRDG